MRRYWIAQLKQRLGQLKDGLFLFSGAIGTIAGLVVCDAYAFRMDAPILKRSIEHRTSCEVLAGAIKDY